MVPTTAPALNFDTVKALYLRKDFADNGKEFQEFEENFSKFGSLYLD